MHATKMEPRECKNGKNGNRKREREKKRAREEC